MSREPGSSDWSLGALRAICTLLPQETREEQFSEWRDEIRCAEENGLAVSRRALSIAVRSLPQLAWRAHRRSRIRSGGPQVASALGKRLPQSIQRSWALTAGRSDWAKALSIALTVALVDLASKAVVSGSLPLFERQHPLPYLTIFHLHNPGISLSFINGGFYLPAALAAVGGGVMLLSFVVGPPQPRLWLVIGLMVGGAVGNLSERIYHGYVTDFLQIGTVPAVFNFADVAIGLAFLLAFSPRFRRAPSNGQGYRRVAAESRLP